MWQFLDRHSFHRHLIALTLITLLQCTRRFHSRPLIFTQVTSSPQPGEAWARLWLWPVFICQFPPLFVRFCFFPIFISLDSSRNVVPNQIDLNGAKTNKTLGYSTMREAFTSVNGERIRFISFSGGLFSHSSSINCSLFLCFLRPVVVKSLTMNG